MSFEDPIFRYTKNIKIHILAMADEKTLYSFSYPGGEPPTPTKTPTSPNFFLDSFQTPKQDSRSHAHQSLFSPSFLSAASPDLKTPTLFNFGTPIKSPSKAQSLRVGKNVEADIASQVEHILSSQSQSSPPSTASQQLPSSPTPSLLPENKRRRVESNNSLIPPLRTTQEQEAGQSMNSTDSLQTPPPTSTSASRRKAQQAQVARLVKESAERGKRMSFPETAKMDNVESLNINVDESPQQFSSLQFSPEGGLGFPMSGPATAPVYPQHKLFWEPDQGGNTTNMDFSLDDTFASLGAHKNLDVFGLGHDGGGIQFPASPAFSLHGTRAENIAPFHISEQGDSAISKSKSITMTRKPSAGIVVNPSLLFSSPGRAAEESGNPPSSQQVQDDNLLPYSQQLRDAQIEMELQMSRKPKRKRGPEIDSPAVKAALQTLRDDHTSVKSDITDDSIPASGARRPSSRNSAGRLGSGRAPEHASVRKPSSRSQLVKSSGTQQQHKRTSVTFTIDANGRAKAETKILTDEDNPAGGQMEVDSDEDSESSSSSSDDPMVMSQTQSFSYPKKQKQPKLGRFSHKAHSHSQKSSYASTLGSGSNARSVSESTSRRPSSSLFMQSKAPHNRRSVKFNDQTAEEAESEAETLIDSEDDKGDAQSALKRVIQSGQKSNHQRPTRLGSMTASTDQRRAYKPPNASTHPYYTNNTATPRRAYHDPYNDTSPTTITDPDLTPRTGQSTISNDSVNCLCHANEDDGALMIQCESCKKWQHESSDKGAFNGGISTT